VNAYPLPGWVADHPGLEQQLNRHAELLAKITAQRSAQMQNYEFSSEAEMIGRQAAELRRRLMRLNDQAGDKFILGNYKREAIESLRTGFKDGWEPDQNALDAAMVGADPYSMQWALGGLQHYLQKLIEADKAAKRSDNKDYQQNIIVLIAGALARAGLPVSNATADKYKQAVNFVFYSAGYGDDDIPTEAAIAKAKNRLKEKSST
jgi:CRISPR/Cas system-associated endoribonuclease Cas2